jgi:hypothetical protein
MSERFVLLYDVGDRRAWLVNGASALLHLVIASLKYELSTPIGYKFLSKVEDLKMVGEQYRANSAFYSLIDEGNMDLPILPGKKKMIKELEKKGDIGKAKIEESNISFSDRVEQVIDYLEKAFIYQEEKIYRSGHEVKFPLRRLLEGFDFAEIAESQTSVPRRITELKATGKGWIDFVRKIKAVTLFGRGFGEIISPTNVPCDFWRKMPTGDDYLAVCVHDLNNIIKRFGVRGKVDMQIVHGIFWHKPDKIFEHCARRDRSTACCDRAQALLPIKFKFFRLLKRIVPAQTIDGKEGGAVIFGSGKKLLVNWPDDPAEIAKEGQLMPNSSNTYGTQVEPGYLANHPSTSNPLEEGREADHTEDSSFLSSQELFPAAPSDITSPGSSIGQHCGDQDDNHKAGLKGT